MNVVMRSVRLSVPMEILLRLHYGRDVKARSVGWPRVVGSDAETCAGEVSARVRRSWERPRPVVSR